MKGEILTLHGWFKTIRPLQDHTTVTLALPNAQLGRDVMGTLAQLCIAQKEGWFMMKTAEFDPEEEEMLKNVEVDADAAAKTPSQIMRIKLYHLWKAKPEGYEDFELFYRFKMNQLNTFIQNKIDK